MLKVMGRTSFERVLFTALYTPGMNGRWGLPLVAEGPPGIGKTAIMKMVVQVAGLFFSTVLASLREPADFLGLPIPSRVSGAMEDLIGEGGVSVRYAPSDFAIDAALARRACIFFDEVNGAPPATQNALLRVINEGFVGQLELPAEVRFMMAMNPKNMATGGWEISMALANRCGWLDWPSPDPREFVGYLMGSQNDRQQPVDAAATEAAVMKEWPARWAQACGTTAGFAMAKSTLLYQPPPPDSDEARKAWPSFRTFEMATRAMGSASVWGLTPQEENLLISSFIGAGAAREVFSWRKNNDLPPADQFLDGLVQFRPDPARLDRTAAVLTSCTALVTPQNAENRGPRAAKLWTFLDTLANTVPDLVGRVVGPLTQANLMLGNPVAYQVLSKVEPVLSAAGVVT